MSLTASVFVQLTDKLAARYVDLLGDFASGNGLGSGAADITTDWGYSRRTRDYVALIIGTADSSVILKALAIAQQSADNASFPKVGSALLYPDMKVLDQLCGAAGLTGVTGMASFAAYYNTAAGGPYTTLLAPPFATLFHLIYPGATTLTAANVYAPAAANLGQITVGGGLVAGTSVDTTKYAGAAVASVVVSGSTWSAAGAITVSAQARTAAGVLLTGRAFTASGISANGTYTLVPTVAGDLLTAITSITVPAEMTAGTATITGSIPAGRVNPPT